MPKHMYEVVADAVVEDFWRRVQIMVDYLQTEGRPIFHKELTKAERLARFLDPTLNSAVSQGLITRQGIEAEESYQRELRNLLERRLPR